jgi:hypothetical protein
MDRENESAWKPDPLAAHGTTRLSTHRPPDKTSEMNFSFPLTAFSWKARLVNRWGCFVGHAFRNFNPPSRFDAHRRPSGASA